MKLRFRFIFFMVFAVAVLPFLTMNCARESQPTGGIKDTIAPVVLWEKPINNSVSVTPKKIIVKWNEKISLEKIQENCIISPPFEKNPKISTSGNKLIIDLKDEKLQENTTYNFLFTNAIKDVNESNVVESYSYAFSGNQQIDSLKIGGKVRYAHNLEIPKSAYVMLYDAKNPDAFKKEKPKYVTQIKKDGSFQITHIAKGTYVVHALEDLNKDLIWNQASEKIALYDSVITPYAFISTDTIIFPAKDSLSRDSIVIKTGTKWSHQNISLLLFQNKNNEFSIINNKRVSKYTYSLKTSMPCKPEDLQINFPDYSNSAYSIEQVSEDSLLIWLQDTSLINKSESKFFITHIPSNTKDTLQLVGFKNLPENIQVNNKNLSNIVFPNDSITLSFTRPIKDYNQAFISVNELKDTNGIFNSYKKPYIFDADKKIVQVLQTSPESPEFVTKTYYESQQVISYKTGLNRFALYFSKPCKPDDIKIALQEYPSQTNWYYAEFDKTTNSLLCWITDPFVMKLKNPAIIVSSAQTGTIIKQINFNPEISKSESYKTIKTGKLIPAISENQKKSFFINNCIEIVCNNPIKEFTDSLFFCYQIKDSLQKNIISKIIINPNSKRKLLIYYSATPGEMYQLTINKSAIVDVYSNSNRQVIYTLKAQISQQLLQYNAIPYTITKNPNNRDFIIKANWKPEKSYAIVFPKNSCIDIYGSSIDSSEIKIQCPKIENYGSIQVMVPSKTENYVYQLVLKDTKKSSSQIIQSKSQKGVVLFQNITPGEYVLRAFLDKNNNNIWDTGSYENKEFPEKIIVFDKSILVKANWENVIEW